MVKGLLVMELLIIKIDGNYLFHSTVTSMLKAFIPTTVTNKSSTGERSRTSGKQFSPLQGVLHLQNNTSIFLPALVLQPCRFLPVLVLQRSPLHGVITCNMCVG